MGTIIDSRPSLGCVWAVAAVDGATRERPTWEFSVGKHERHPIGKHSGNLHGAAILHQCVGNGHHDHPVGQPPHARGVHPCAREGGQTKDKAGEAWDRRKPTGKGKRPARRGRDAIRPVAVGGGTSQRIDRSIGPYRPRWLPAIQLRLAPGSTAKDGKQCWRVWYRSQRL
jgi:hypothetical protein